MLKLVFIFLIGIAYAAQTRIKIGSKSWGYQIDLNQGQNIRKEFSNDEGITRGIYIFKVDNETKKLEYEINPNSKEPDISFNVTMVAVQENQTEPEVSNSTSTTTEENNGTTDLVSPANMTFDSIDSNQDFKGHVTLKVGNATYNINFVTGDKSNTREEIMLPSGLMYGRIGFQLKNNPTNKVVINYKFNSTSPDPTFEVSLFKSSDSDSNSGPSSSGLSGSYPSQNYRLGYQRNLSPYPTSGSLTPSSVSRDNSGSRHPYPSSLPSSLPEKYRHNQPLSPNWYYNRNKVYDP